MPCSCTDRAGGASRAAYAYALPSCIHVNLARVYAYVARLRRQPVYRAPLRCALSPGTCTYRALPGCLAQRQGTLSLLASDLVITRGVVLINDPRK
jgi:hypothetical protein